jgi:amidohydrolase
MRQYIHAAVERTARLIAESAGAEIDFVLDQGPPPLNNDAGLTAMMIPALERASGHPIVSLQPQTVAEDFAEYGRLTPAVFIHLGNWPEALDPATQPTNHSPKFHMHEPYMETGVKAFGHMVMDYLKAQ